MNRTTVYSTTNRVANQIKTLEHIGLFAAPAGDPSRLGTFVEPFGEAPLNERARAYMHANCSHCHRGNARGPNLHFDTAEADMRLCGASPLVVPGSPANSRVIQLMSDPDPSMRMPRGSGNIIDARGVSLIEDWIRAKSTCP